MRPKASLVERPTIIGHRGAAGHRPEHTPASYRLAIALGADFIEPDLVSTRDGRLIARHEPELSQTTDVAERFPDRRTTHEIDGIEVTGWFAAEFTLEEVKTLRCRQRWDFRSTAWDDLHPVMTFEEVLELAAAASRESGRTIGVYPETKHPTWHAGLGLALEEPLLAALEAAGHTGPEAPVFIQSFEVGNLRDLATRTGVRLIQLLEDGRQSPHDFEAAGIHRTYAEMMTPAGLAEIATYAHGIGPWKRSIVGETAERRLKPAGTLIDDAHAAGLVVHAYTFRDEPRFLAEDHGDDPEAEIRMFLDLGLDGLFADFPDTAFRARAAFLAERRP